MGLCASTDGEPTSTRRQASNSKKYRTFTMMERLNAKCSSLINRSFSVRVANKEDKQLKGKFYSGLYPGFNFWGRKQCQDAYLVYDINENRVKKPNKEIMPYILFGVFDGHGMYGEKVSDYIIRQFPNVFLKHATTTNEVLTNTSSVQKAFSCTFKDLHQNLAKDRTIDSSLSGSTATAILLGHDKLHCAWVGDSKALVAVKDENGKLVPEDLTFGHNFSLRGERKRVERTGGLVRQSSDELGNRVGPFRVFLRGKNGPGLAVSRSLGDTIAHSAGVIPEPDHKTIPIEDRHQFIVLASDGVWDQMESEELVQFIADRKHDDTVCEQIIMTCAERWIDGNQGLTDDISCIIVYIKPEWYAPSKSPASSPGPEAAKGDEKQAGRHARTISVSASYSSGDIRAGVRGQDTEPRPLQVEDDVEVDGSRVKRTATSTILNEMSDERKE